jgi:WD40 repeat protein
MQEFSIEGEESVCPGINAFVYCDERLVIGTRGSEVFEYDFNAETGVREFSTAITHGHYSPSSKDLNEVWGLATFPNKEWYVTVSDDATLRVWDLKEKKQLKCIDLRKDEAGNDIPMDKKTKELSSAVKARSVDVRDGGKMIAVGF